MLRKRVSGINAIDWMLRMVARLLLVAEIEQFEGNAGYSYTADLKGNIKEFRRSPKSNNTHGLVFKLLYLRDQKESRDHPQHRIYRIDSQNAFSEQFTRLGGQRSFHSGYGVRSQKWSLTPPGTQFCYKHE